MAAAVFVKRARTLNGERLTKCFRMKSFQALGVNDVIANRLAKLGIREPTEIQEKAISTVSDGRNTIINAETGSGKTLCYLLPIVNKLINEPSLVNSPPHALILLPTIELCHQVASVFKTIADPDMFPCIVSRDSNLLINSSYPVVMAMPSTLLSYNLDVLSNIRVVVTDEADFLTTSGGKDVWRLLNFFKHGKLLKRKSRHALKSHQQSTLQNDTRTIEKEISHKLDMNNSNSNMDFPPPRQFVFVAATLPSKGKKASLNVLTKWLSQPEVVTTSVVHQKLPTLDMEYVKVTEDTKLPQLLRCLNILAGFIKFESENIDGGKMEVKFEGVNSETLNGKIQRQSSEINECGTRSGNSKYKEKFHRVLVFTNTAKQASKVFQFLCNQDKQEANQQQSISVNQDSTNQGLAEAVLIDTGSKVYWKDKCAELHKDVPVDKRLDSLERFKSGELKVLVCTDLASRGLDIPDVSHVIQLDFASNAAHILHRAGRTARAGTHGTVINFITTKDEDLARAIRACDDDPNINYDKTTFSRNRMFRRRIKRNTLPLADCIQYTAN